MSANVRFMRAAGLIDRSIMLHLLFRPSRLVACLCGPTNSGRAGPSLCGSWRRRAYGAPASAPTLGGLGGRNVTTRRQPSPFGHWRRTEIQTNKSAHARRQDRSGSIVREPMRLHINLSAGLLVKSLCTHEDDITRPQASN